MRLAFRGALGYMPHTHKWSPYFKNFDRFWSFTQKSLNSLTSVVCLWHMYRWTTPLRTPSSEPPGCLLETLWSWFSKQRWSFPSGKHLPGRPDYAGAQMWLKELDLCYCCVCACGKPLHRSPHGLLMKDSAGCAAFVRQDQRDSMLLFFRWPKKWHPSWGNFSSSNLLTAAAESKREPE